jgi:hypothetical protein
LKAKVDLLQSFSTPFSTATSASDNSTLRSVTGLNGTHCGLHSSARDCKIWEVPSQTEGNKSLGMDLKFVGVFCELFFSLVLAVCYNIIITAASLAAVYKDPKSLFHSLLEPLVDSGLTSCPHLTITPKLSGRFWRARLQLEWPSKVTIAAVNSSLDKAERNAYLLACDLFKVHCRHTCTITCCYFNTVWLVIHSRYTLQEYMYNIFWLQAVLRYLLYLASTTGYKLCYATFFI